MLGITSCNPEICLLSAAMMVTCPTTTPA